MLKSDVIIRPMRRVSFSIPLTNPSRRLPEPTSSTLPRTRIKSAKIRFLILPIALVSGASMSAPISVKLLLISVIADLNRPTTVSFNAANCPPYALANSSFSPTVAINFSKVVLPAFTCSAMTFLNMGLNPSPCFLTESVSFPSFINSLTNLDTSPKFLPASPPMPAATFPIVRIAAVACPSF